MRRKRRNIVIVASGPSVRAVRRDDILAAGAVVIAVNGAIYWLGRADYSFTLDPSQINLVRANNRVRGCKYVMALPDNMQAPPGVTRMARQQGDAYGKARALQGLSEDKNAIHTGNSAFGALGLAYHLCPQRVVLLGVDGTQERRVDGGYSRTLKHLPELFSSAVPQLRKRKIDVVNGSPDSRVACFSRMTPQEALCWLKS